MTDAKSPYGGGPGAGISLPPYFRTNPLGEKPSELLPKQRAARAG